MKGLDTIIWLNREIDKINAEATIIGELLLQETEYKFVEILDERLSEMEKKMKYLQQKIDFEKNQLIL